MKTSSIDRVVGKFPAEEKLAIFAKYATLFKRQNDIRMDMSPSICSKTRDQLKIIEEVNEATNVLRRKYGLEDFDVPESNIHVLDAHMWRGTKTDSLFIPKTQSILIKRTSRNTRFAVSLFRAMVQFKSYGAVQKKTGTGEATKYRIGFAEWPRLHANSLSAPRALDRLKFFQELNDGIVEELTVRWFASQHENPLFKNELEETREICANGDMLEKSVFLSHDVYDIQYDKVRGCFDLMPFTDHDERILVKATVESIFLSHDRLAINDVFDALARPMFTGRLFELLRLMAGTPESKGIFPKRNTRKSMALLV